MARARAPNLRSGHGTACLFEITVDAHRREHPSISRCRATMSVRFSELLLRSWSAETGSRGSASFVVQLATR
jgi:hypothetical protein